MLIVISHNLRSKKALALTLCRSSKVREANFLCHYKEERSFKKRSLYGRSWR